MEISELFEQTVALNASDLHLIAGSPPIVRVDGRLVPIDKYGILTKEVLEKLLLSIITEVQKDLLINNKSIDFSYGFGGGEYGDVGRFRANYYFQKGTLGADFRLLPQKVRTIEELGLPAACHTFAGLKQGFILITGPTGQGKSTTLASMVNEINMARGEHILTIEDPIEYIYPKGKSIISQRELELDTNSWAEALRSALREDPDVVLIGEMRDPESIASAITIAETGHLVFSTLHTNSAAQTIDRIIDVFPSRQQAEIRSQLASIIQGIVSQRLIPRIDGGRQVAYEVMLGTNAVKSNIREGKTHLIDSIIETSSAEGMITFESSLATLVKQGIVTLETAQQYALRPESLNRLVA